MIEPSDRSSGSFHDFAFVGRRPELSRLCRGVEDAVVGLGARLWLVGPAGIGKTRLAEELLCYARLRGVPNRSGDAAILEKNLDSPDFAACRVLVVDPVLEIEQSQVEAELQRFVSRGGFAVAAARRLDDARTVPVADRVVLAGLDVGEIRRVLTGAMGREPRSVELERALRETRGNPRELVEWIGRTRSGRTTQVRAIPRS